LRELDPELVRSFFAAQLEAARLVQQADFDRWKANKQEPFADTKSLVVWVTLGGILVYGHFGAKRPGGNPMNESRFPVEYVCLGTDKPFEEVAEARAKIEAMAGPSDFMLFGTNDHGALLRLAGQRRKAVQYVIGNPLFALQMTQHDIRAGLSAPLRVLVYEAADSRSSR
jgi:uncharacterized protein (DUF302 family)